MIGGLLLAAGSGSRMQGEVEDKLLHPIGAAHAFSLSCDAFLSVEELDCVVITYRNHDQLSRLQESWSHSLTGFAHSKKKDVFWVQGGKERQDSVYAGLLAFPETMTHILIHDCARPFIRPHTISHCCQEIIRNQAITVARPVKDTLRVRLNHWEEPHNPGSTHTIDRANHWAMETPQGAPKSWLLEGLEKAKKENISLTDDIAAIELLGHPVGFLEPKYPNPKITTSDDFAYAQFLIQS